MLGKIELSLDNAKGHAHLTRGNNVVIYLPTLTGLLHTPREYFPFNTIEELFEELTVHELLHIITKVKKDSIIDSWHMFECRLLNNLQRCNCPIDCFFRDCLVDVDILDKKVKGDGNE